MGESDIIRFLAMWELIHESADEGLKAAIARGSAQESGDMARDPGAFVDGLTAMVDAEKDRIKTGLSSSAKGGEPTGQADGSKTSVVSTLPPVQASIDDLRFEIAALRGQVESLTTSVDALSSRLENAGLNSIRVQSGSSCRYPKD
ncbi:MAG: hypothetical protein HGA54_03625 [Actinobacteria bacterium]|nr:hypothetical protein [Actinomycetota bacterium]